MHCSNDERMTNDHGKSLLASPMMQIIMDLREKYDHHMKVDRCFSFNHTNLKKQFTRYANYDIMCI